jgi:hypothetical protein
LLRTSLQRLFGVRSSTLATIAFAGRAITAGSVTLGTITSRSTTTALLSATALTTPETLKHSAEFFLVDKSILVAIQPVEAFLHAVRGFFFGQLTILVGVRFIKPSQHLFRPESSTIASFTLRTVTVTWWTIAPRSVTVTWPTITTGTPHRSQFVGSDSTIPVTIHPTQHHDGLVNFIGFQDPITVSIQCRHNRPARTSTVTATRRSSTGATALTFAGSIPVPATFTIAGSVSITPSVPRALVSSTVTVPPAGFFTGLIPFFFLSTFARLVAVLLCDRPIRRHHHCGDGQESCCKLVHISVP